VGESLELFQRASRVETRPSTCGAYVWDEAEGGRALFSADRTRRYWLGRRWAPGLANVAVWVMLNPSKAGAADGDLTVAKCIGFSKLLGADALAIVNLFSLISTDPAVLLEHPDPVGSFNDESVRGWTFSASWVIAAWGGHEAVTTERVEDMRLRLRGREVLCLGRTKSGAPRHPSRLAYSTPFETFWEAR
jgi:hypothetical protein